MTSKEKTLAYRYRFRFANGVEKQFSINLNYKTLELIKPKNEIPPEWTKMKHFMCPNCPLDEKKHKYCPAAVNITSIIEEFKDSISYEMVDIFIETETRSFSKHTSLQEAINSLIGICMVSSGCPVLELLKPMVNIHLPFSTLQERKYRVLTMYLLAQYFIKKRGGKPDWDFKHLVDIFEDIRIVNKNFCDKLSEIRIKDATLNALITLDAFAFHTSFYISENMLHVLEHPFDAYFRKYERRRKRRSKKK
jgi:hypothetical protein